MCSSVLETAPGGSNPSSGGSYWRGTRAENPKYCVYPPKLPASSEGEGGDRSATEPPPFPSAFVARLVFESEAMGGAVGAALAMAPVPTIHCSVPCPPLAASAMAFPAPEMNEARAEQCHGMMERPGFAWLETESGHKVPSFHVDDPRVTAALRQLENTSAWGKP